MEESRKLIFRCYAERDSDGTWFGMCLDLNLYARASTAEDVQAKLHDIIADHIETVLALPVEEQLPLLSRPAPLAFRLRYAWHLFRAVIGALFHPRPPSGGSSFRKFDEASPAGV